MEAPRSNINAPEIKKLDEHGPMTIPTPINPHNVTNHLDQPTFSLNMIAAKINVNIGIVKSIKDAILRGIDFNPMHQSVMLENNTNPRMICANGLDVFMDCNGFFNMNGNNVIAANRNRKNTICNGWHLRPICFIIESFVTQHNRLVMNQNIPIKYLDLCIFIMCNSDI
jgi:hypothetical protein